MAESNTFPFRLINRILEGDSRRALAKTLGIDSLSKELPTLEKFALKPEDVKKLRQLYIETHDDPQHKPLLADITSDGHIDRVNNGFFANIDRRYLKRAVPMVVRVNPRQLTARDVEAALKLQTKIDNRLAIQANETAQEAATQAVLDVFKNPGSKARKILEKTSEIARNTKTKADRARWVVGSDLAPRQQQMVKDVQRREFAARYPSKKDLKKFAEQSRYARSMAYISEGMCYIVVNARKSMPVTEKGAEKILTWYKHYTDALATSHVDLPKHLYESQSHLDTMAQLELSKYAEQMGLVVFVADLAAAVANKPLEFKRLESQALSTSLLNRP